MPPLWFLQELEDRKRRRDAGQASRPRPSTAPQASPLVRQAATNSARQAVTPTIGQYNVPLSSQNQQRPERGTQTTPPQPRHVANTRASRTSQTIGSGSGQNVEPGPSRHTSTELNRPTAPVFGRNIATSSFHPPAQPRAGQPSTTQQPMSSHSQPQIQSQPPSRTHSKHKKVDSGAHVDFPPHTTNPTDTSMTRPAYRDPDLDPSNPFRDPSPTLSSTPTATEPLLFSTQCSNYPTGEGDGQPIIRRELVKMEPYYKSAWKKMKKWVKEKRDERRERDRGESRGMERTRGRERTRTGGRGQMPRREEMEGGYDGFYMMAD